MSHDAWRAIADALAAPTSGDNVRLGHVTLLPHQAEAVARLRATLDAHQIALLADDTGLGKTYVACALAREADHPLVVAPAAVRDVWSAASDRTGTTLRVVSHEALSRGHRVTTPPDLLIVDEAHHARTPATRRWHALAELSKSARVLLLSATPMHNAPRELAALFALRLGTEAEHAVRAPQQLVVRRRREDLVDAPRLPRIPDVAPWHWHPAPEHPGVAAALAALPPALPPIDGREAAPLWRLGLVRAWASSDAALRAAVRRRLARGLALEQALREGRPLTRAALARWAHDDVVQPTLALDAPLASAPPAMTHSIVTTHVDALGALLRMLSRSSADAARAAAVAASLDAAPGIRAVLFCSYAATADAYWHHLRHRPGTALATGRGGRIASGPAPRADLFAALEREAPARRHAREQVRLLIATDVASEGLSLTAASAVWHADLPWTPARLAQRTGRLARLGAPHPSIAVHAFAPPATSDETLALRDRLAAKADATREIATDDRLSGITGASHDSTLDALRQLRQFAARHAAPRAAHGTPIGRRPEYPTAVAVSDRHASVALLGAASHVMTWTFLTDDAHRPRAPDPSPRSAWRILRDSEPYRVPRAHWPTAVQLAVRRARARLEHARRATALAADALGVPGHAAPSAPALATDPAARLLRALASALRRVGAEQRAEAAETAAKLRRRLARPLAAGWRPALDALVARPPDRRWWTDAAALVASIDAGPPTSPLPPISALVVLVPDALAR